MKNNLEGVTSQVEKNSHLTNFHKIVKVGEIVVSMIENRLKKNYEKIKKYLKSVQTEAFRLYDKDIPEYPYQIDIYNEFALLYEKGISTVADEMRVEKVEQITKALFNLLQIKRESCFVKTRDRKDHVQSQYEKVEKEEREYSYTTVREGEAVYKINLNGYLDTGLFLDHRPLRSSILSDVRKKGGGHVLNLFSYTGSISIAAALGGAKTVSIDWSNTYQSWAKENFHLNGFTNQDFKKDHEFITEDARRVLREWSKHLLTSHLRDRKFDIIIIDPPTFSNSKIYQTRKEECFEVEKDYLQLIEDASKLLLPDGKIYFSTNKRSFHFDFEKIKSILPNFKIRDLTTTSIPKDFRDQKIHKLYQLEQVAR